MQTSSANRAMNMLGQSSQTYGAMDKKRDVPPTPGKTLGGAMASSASLGLAGYMAAGASKGAFSGPTGGIVGGVAGALMYLLS